MILNLKVMDMADKLAAQQRVQAGDVVTNVLAGNRAEVLTPASIATAYGSNLATGTAVASDTAPQTELGGTTITIKDSGGVLSSAPIFFVSPGQVNYLVPATVDLGAGVVTVRSGDGTAQTGLVTIADIRPGVFTLNGELLVGATVIRVTPDGHQVAENVFEVDGAGNVVPSPLDVTNGQVYLALYGTGFRSAPLEQVSVYIGGVNAPVLYSGVQGTNPGLDQIDVQVPAELAGRGEEDVVVIVADKMANSTRITIR